MELISIDGDYNENSGKVVVTLGDLCEAQFAMQDRSDKIYFTAMIAFVTAVDIFTKKKFLKVSFTQPHPESQQYAEFNGVSLDIAGFIRVQLKVVE